MNKRTVAERQVSQMGVQDLSLGDLRSGPMTDVVRREPSQKPLSEALVRTQDWERMAREADFRPAKMASLCSISERHLQRIFRKYLQCTPSYWLRDLQCRLA